MACVEVFGVSRTLRPLATRSAQSEEAKYENDDHNEADDIDDIVHFQSPRPIMQRRAARTGYCTVAASPTLTSVSRRQFNCWERPRRASRGAAPAQR